METRPTTAVPFVPQAPVRVEAAPVRGAVRTDLPIPQAVAAQAGAEQTRWQKSHDPADKGAAFDRQKSAVTLDRETGDLVYQILEPGTRAVLVQTPHESILKLRAYIHTADRQRKMLSAQERAQEIRSQEMLAQELHAQNAASTPAALES